MDLNQGGCVNEGCNPDLISFLQLTGTEVERLTNTRVSLVQVSLLRLFVHIDIEIMEYFNLNKLNLIVSSEHDLVQVIVIRISEFIWQQDPLV